VVRYIIDDNPDRVGTPPEIVIQKGLPIQRIGAFEGKFSYLHPGLAFHPHLVDTQNGVRIPDTQDSCRFRQRIISVQTFSEDASGKPVQSEKQHPEEKHLE
jgi:hypothetical protein